HRYLHSFPTRRSSDLAVRLSAAERVYLLLHLKDVEHRSTGQPRAAVPTFVNSVNSESLCCRRFRLRCYCSQREPIRTHSVPLLEDRKSTRLNSSHVAI